MKKLIFSFLVVLGLLVGVSCSIVSVSGEKNGKALSPIDLDKVVVTRDLSGGKRQSYSEYLLTRQVESKSLNARTVSVPLNNPARAATPAASTITLIVNSALYSSTTAAITTYINDLQAEGCQVILHLVNNNGSPQDLKALIKADYINQGISSAFLVGNVPVPWYEMHESWENNYVQFPCDYYLMDLDGDWGDTNNNGIFDLHGGNFQADISVARLVAQNLKFGSPQEISQINNYFKKNHDYRTGVLRLQDKSICVVNEDWAPLNWENEFLNAYPSQTLIKEPHESVTADAYRNSIKKSANNKFESLLLLAHSSPQTHWFYQTATTFNNHEIPDLGIQVNFYNLFCCSGARFTEDDNLGVWYVLQSEYGLNCVGSTKTGSMMWFANFYTPMGEGKTLGESYLQWFKSTVTLEWNNQTWFNGMVMIGDPTLKISRFQGLASSSAAVSSKSSIQSSIASSSSSGGTGGPSGYTYCAGENQTYTFTQTVDVAYGANGSYNYKTGVTGTIAFNNATFGDPIPGVVKSGYYKLSLTQSSSKSSTVSSKVSSAAVSSKTSSAPVSSSSQGTASSAAGGNYAVNYTINNDWGSGATVTVTIKNNSAAAVNGWTLAWAFAGNQTIVNHWSSTISQSGASVSANSLSYNGTIPANGGTQSFGFNLSYTGANSKPVSFTLNGTVCSLY